MKKIIISFLALAYVLMLTGCNNAPNANSEVPFDFAVLENTSQSEMSDNSQKTATTPDLEPDTKEPHLLESLPTTLATSEDIDGSGGY